MNPFQQVGLFWSKELEKKRNSEKLFLGTTAALFVAGILSKGIFAMCKRHPSPLTLINIAKMSFTGSIVINTPYMIVDYSDRHHQKLKTKSEKKH